MVSGELLFTYFFIISAATSVCFQCLQERCLSCWLGPIQLVNVSEGKGACEKKGMRDTTCGMSIPESPRAPSPVGISLQRIRRNVQPCTSGWWLLGKLEGSPMRSILELLVDKSFINSFSRLDGSGIPALILVLAWSQAGSWLGSTVGWVPLSGVLHQQAKATPEPPNVQQQH